MLVLLTKELKSTNVTELHNKKIRALISIILKSVI